MKMSRTLACVGLAAAGVLPAAAIDVVFDFENVTTPNATGFKAPAAIGNFYAAADQGGVSFANAFAITGGQNVLNAQGSLGLINVNPGGNGNFWVSRGINLDPFTGSPILDGSGSPSVVFPLNDPRVQLPVGTSLPPKVQPDIGQSVMTFGNATDATLNRASGFTGSFSFYFSSQSNLSVRLWDQVNGTGSALNMSAVVTDGGIENNELFKRVNNTPLSSGSLIAFDAQSGLGCNTAGPGGNPYYCNWSFVTVQFSGTARSISFSNLGGTFGLGEGDAGSFGTGIDGIRLYNAIDSVPEPATYALMALGLLGIGIARRRQMR